MNYTIQALGWTLIHFCWQAIVVAMAYRFLDAALSRTRSQIRYVIALVSLMSLLGIAASTFFYEQKRVAVESISYALITADGKTIYAQPDCDKVATAAALPSNDRSSLKGLQFIAGDIEAWMVRVLPGDMLSWIDAIWFAGVLALSVRLLGGWLTLRRLRSSTRMTAPLQVYASFVGLASKMGIARRVDLRVCQRIAGPVAIGVIRSVIILPVAALSHLTPEQLQVVLAHELAHIRRADYLWNMLQTVVETLFFFHPAVWWLGNRTRQMREICCDDEALAACGDPMIYATALLSLEEQRNHRVRLAMAFQGSKGSLKSRIIRILEGRQDRANIRGREVIPMSLVGIAATLAVFLMPVPRTVAKAAVTDGQPQISVAQSSAVAAPSAPLHTVENENTKSPVISTETLRPLPVASPEVPSQLVPVVSAPVSPVTAHVIASPRVDIHAIEVKPKIVVDAKAIAMVAIAARHVDLHPYAAQAGGTSHAMPGEEYVQRMNALGYNDTDKLIAMKVHGITVDYAQQMAKANGGTLAADELIELKIFGVSPEEVEKAHAQSGDRTALKELVRYKIFKVTPEFVSAMKSAGFGDLSSDKLVALKVQNVTPEFASSMRQKYPQITADQLIQMKIFRIDDSFIATAKSHGFESLSLEKLIRLRMSGLLDDNSLQR